LRDGYDLGVVEMLPVDKVLHPPQHFLPIEVFCHVIRKQYKLGELFQIECLLNELVPNTVHIGQVDEGAQFDSHILELLFEVVAVSAVTSVEENEPGLLPWVKPIGLGVYYQFIIHLIVQEMHWPQLLDEVLILCRPEFLLRTLRYLGLLGLLLG
jgi:hypothetical protein